GLGVELAADAVFRAEQRHELYIVGLVQQIDRTAARPIDAGMIRDQAQAAAFQRAEVLAHQDVYAGENRADGPGWRRRRDGQPRFRKGRRGDAGRYQGGYLAAEAGDVALAIGVDAVTQENNRRARRR